MKNYSFTIIIPTYNEQDDIKETIESLIRMDWKFKEIIIVDDSNDRTPDIISEYLDRGIKLIIPPVRRGRSEARNIGIKSASGEILVILNADVHLPKKFLYSLNKIYNLGFDSISVTNTIKNQKYVYARLLEARKRYKVSRGVYKKWADLYNGVFWTEGFSVKKKIALKTNLFPSGFDIPIEAGEDARFAEDLRKLNCKGFFAENIEVPHIAPETLSEFWKIRVGRGAGTPQIRYYLDGWPHYKISLWRYAKNIQRISMIIMIFPMLFRGFILAKAMKNNILIEMFKYSWALTIEEIAKSYGEYQSHNKIKKVKKAV